VYILLVVVVEALPVQRLVLVVEVLDKVVAHKVLLALQTQAVVVVAHKIGLVEMVGLDALLFLFQPQTIQAQQLDLQLL
jgi:hypothetical protein